ncbi:MAG: hypothetical protein KKD44_07945 [Proteobacteria bacterium]|nr:hypothetical protein [Pseudomonadota bacterium]
MVRLYQRGILVILVVCFLTLGCATKNKNIETDTDHQALFNSLQGLTVQNLQGEPVLLDSLWQDRKVVLVYLRHYG